MIAPFEFGSRLAVMVFPFGSSNLTLQRRARQMAFLTKYFECASSAEARGLLAQEVGNWTWLSKEAKEAIVRTAIIKCNDTRYGPVYQVTYRKEPMMKFLVKARNFGTVEVEIEATRLTLEVAEAAAKKAIEEEFEGAAYESEYITVYEAENVNHGRIVNIREGQAHLVR
jgi:hypothetical protein